MAVSEALESGLLSLHRFVSLLHVTEQLNGDPVAHGKVIEDALDMHPTLKESQPRAVGAIATPREEKR